MLLVPYITTSLMSHFCQILISDCHSVSYSEAAAIYCTHCCLFVCNNGDWKIKYYCM